MERTSIHEYIYGLIKRAYGKRVINISELRVTLSKCPRMPRRYNYQVIKELIDMKLLIKIDRDNYAIKEDERLIPLFDKTGTPLWTIWIVLSTIVGIVIGLTPLSHQKTLSV